MSRRSRQSRRRRYGGALLAFGISGIGLVLAAGVLVLGSLAAVNDAATGFERQRAEILAMLGPASSALSNAATSASNAGASLTETSEAARRAGELTSSLAESFEGLSSLSNFEVLGTRPFGQLGGQFAAVGTQARALSTDLDAVAGAMSTNIADSQAVAEDLRALSAQLATLEASLGGSSTGVGDTALPVNAARIVLLGLLAWLAIPALFSTWLGWRLVRAPPR